MLDIACCESSELAVADLVSVILSNVDHLEEHIQALAQSTIIDSIVALKTLIEAWCLALLS